MRLLESTRGWWRKKGLTRRAMTTIMSLISAFLKNSGRLQITPVDGPHRRLLEFQEVPLGAVLERRLDSLLAKSLLRRNWVCR